MSVSGEFQRVLADCCGLLDRAGGPDQPLAHSLGEAGRRGRNDLVGAAEHVLDMLDTGPAPAFGSELEREEFARVRDHLSQICRVILGR
ncbi:MAG: hypothetical protein QNK04_10110 [Myxococcota bacterium]|nr:hypothetical protein [Myxococcota bacterium]